MSKHKQRPRQSDSQRREAAGPLPTIGGEKGSSRSGRWLAVGALAVLAAAVAGYNWWSAHPATAVAGSMSPTVASATHGKVDFIGAKACAGCHESETRDWQASQHAKAMQHANDSTVLADFDNARFEYAGITSTFFKRGGKFYVNTDGTDGKLADFEISYVFGLYPLQQYLVKFPDGRMQALSIAWDARPESEGGARWYHLYPDEKIVSGDPLHWTRLNQNWNWMCADCHTTNLDRNYNPADNTYATTWSEMNVACEACHGPGGNHLAWAKKEPGADAFAADHGLVVALNERKSVNWIYDPATSNVARSVPLTSQRELTVCAQCHSRRSPFAKGMDHDGRFLETHEVALLTDGLYFADGQQQDEVYNIGSFLQSKMHAKGVTCSDCHNPHSGKTRAPGNAVCAQCHTPVKYDVVGHTMHATGSAGAQCASCHMPTRTYMGVDPRHDHSFRIPRPDLSEALDSPNACTGCHKDRDSSWAANAIERNFGSQRKGFQTFGDALHAGRTGAAGASEKLVALANDKSVPAIARATALAELVPYLSSAVVPTIEAGLADPDPMIRNAALDALQSAPPTERARLGIGMIDDPSVLVRIKAARVLAIIENKNVGAGLLTRLEAVFAEYVASQRANADRPEAHVNLGLFFSERREPIQAEGEYRAAIALEPDFVPGYVNLADLYRTYDREPEAEAVLDQGLQNSPGDGNLLHSLGLMRVRQGRMADALPLLIQAAEAAPGNPRYAYVGGVALHDSGRVEEGMLMLERALKRFPNDLELLSALVSYSSDAGDARRARLYQRRLAALAPRAGAEPGVEHE